MTVTGATRTEAEGARSAPNFRCRDAVPLDVRDDAAIRALVDDLPRLDVLVNCAGVIRRGDEHDPDVFADVVDINLTGTMRCCAIARPKLRRAGGGGRIVNTASMLSFQAGGLVPGYSASKGGVAQLTKSLAIAYAADGIRVNAVAPGWVKTALTRPTAKRPAAQRRDPRAHAARPLGRAGGRRRRGRFPVFACRTLRHRRHPAGRRRLSHT